MDNRTIAVMLIITLAVCSLIMIVSTYSRRLAGTRNLSLWLVLQTAGIILLSTQGYTPKFLGVMTARVLLFSSIIFLAIGLSRFLNVKIHAIFFIAYTVLFTVLIFLYTYITPLTYVRVALISSTEALLYSRLAFVSVKNMKKGTTFLFILRVIFVLNAVFLLARSVFAFIHPMRSIFSGDFMTASFFILMDVTAIGVTLCFINLQNERLIEQDAEMRGLIKKSEELYSQTLAGIGDAVITCGGDKNVEFMNPAAEELTGWPFCEALGKPLDEIFLIQNEMGEKIENPADHVLENGIQTGLTVHSILIRKDKSRTMIENDCSPIKDGSGILTGAVLVFRDVTLRRVAEERFRFLASLLANISDVVYSTDLEFRVTSWNTAAEKMYGWKEEEVLGKQIFDLVASKFDPAKRRKFFRELSVKGSAASQIEHTTKTGRYVIFDSITIALKNLAENVNGFVWVNRDITARRKAEEALWESEERFRTIAETVPVLICITRTGDSIVMFTNEVNNRAFGLRGEEIVGTRGPDYYCDPADRIKMLELFKENGFVDNYRLKVKKNDGTPFWIITSVRPIVYEGHPAIIGASIDITKYKKNEDALRESEERFRSVLDNSSDVIYRVNLQTGRFEYVSPSIKSVTGFSPEEIMALPIDSALEMIHPDDLPGVRAAHIRLEVTLVENLRYRQRTKKGKYRWLSNHLTLVKDNFGIPLYRDGNFQDITENMLLEGALRESEKKFRELLRFAPTAIYEINFRTKKFETVNDAMVQLSGYTKEELLSMNPFDILCEEDKSVFLERVNLMMQGKEVNDQIEYKVKAKDGRIIHALLNIKFNPDKNGKTMKATVVGYDITERKKTEEEREHLLSELNRRAAELDAVFKALPQLVSVHAADGRYTKANPAIVKLFGLDPTTASREEIARRLNAQFPDGRPLTPENMPSSRALKGETVNDVEYVITDSRGQKHTLLFNGVPLFEDNKPKGAVFAQVDITDRKNVENELLKAKVIAEKANLAKDLLIANVSHELRTPLNAIMGYAQLLNKSRGLTDKQRESVEVIYSSGHLLLNMINDLLDMAKLEAGKMKIENTEFSLPELLKRIADAIRVQTDEKELEFVLETASALPVSVTGDEKRLSQVLLNLLGNAVKFTDKGKIKLRVGRVDDAVRFEVEDTGIGIPADQIGIIFDSFQQLDTGQAKSKGTGLGLSISRNLVKLMGSDLSVKSEIGKGSTFWFDVHFNPSVSQFVEVDSITFRKAEKEDFLPLPVPPPEELRKLYDLVKTGDIIGFRKQIEKTEEDHPESELFASKLKTLAKNINLMEMENLIEKYLEK